MVFIYPTHQKSYCRVRLILKPKDETHPLLIINGIASEENIVIRTYALVLN